MKLTIYVYIFLYIHVQLICIFDVNSFCAFFLLLSSFFFFNFMRCFFFFNFNFNFSLLFFSLSPLFSFLFFLFDLSIFTGIFSVTLMQNCETNQTKNRRTIKKIPDSLDAKPNRHFQWKWMSTRSWKSTMRFLKCLNSINKTRKLFVHSLCYCSGTHQTVRYYLSLFSTECFGGCFYETSGLGNSVSFGVFVYLCANFRCQKRERPRSRHSINNIPAIISRLPTPKPSANTCLLCCSCFSARTSFSRWLKRSKHKNFNKPKISTEINQRHHEVCHPSFSYPSGSLQRWARILTVASSILLIFYFLQGTGLKEVLKTPNKSTIHQPCRILNWYLILILSQKQVCWRLSK